MTGKVDTELALGVIPICRLGVLVVDNDGRWQQCRQWRDYAMCDGCKISCCV